MASPRAVLELVDLVYDTISHPEEWIRFLSAYRDAVGSATVTLFRSSGENGGDEFLYVEPLPPEAVRDYEERFNPWQREVVQRSGIRRPVFCWSDLMPSAEYHRSEFYNEWMRPLGLEDSLGAAIPAADGGMAGFGALGEHGRRPFGARELELTEALLPHVGRALELRRHLGDAVRRGEAARAALEQLAVGVILLAEDGRFLGNNRAAAAIVATRDGLELSADGPVAASPKATARLRHLVREAIATAARRGLGAGGAVALPRPSGCRPLHALVTPLPLEGNPFGSTRAAAAIFVTDPELRPELPAAALASLFGMTPAEARVAALLAVGSSPNEVAEQLEIRVQTVRSHLKAIFQKTDTRRQGELVALLLRSMATLGRGEWRDG